MLTWAEWRPDRWRRRLGIEGFADAFFHFFFDLFGQLLDLFRLLDHIQRKHVFIGFLYGILELAGKLVELLRVRADFFLSLLVGFFLPALFHVPLHLALVRTGRELSRQTKPGADGEECNEYECNCSFLEHKTSRTWKCSDYKQAGLRYNPAQAMELRVQNLWHDWHEDLIRFARFDVPKLLAILLLAFILVRLLTFITRKMVELSKRRAVHPSIRAQQISTVVGVIRSAGIFVILLVTVMQALQVFGINVAPLLASAGIAGLAIGFGAQTLVKDVINGFFILVENQFEVGDVIKAAGVQGAVEEVTMRRTILRDADGTVHIVPNGSIQIVSNTTRDWSQAAVHVAVDYSEDTDRVIQILREAALELYNDDEFQADMVAEPTVPGIERVSGHEVDYLILLKVRPGQQYAVTRELRRRVKACLEKNQIKAAVPVIYKSS